MFRWIHLLPMLTAVCLLLSACGRTDPGTTDKTVIITPAIKGNSASLNVGDTLEVQIPTIPTKGFEWMPQDLDKAILAQQGSVVYKQDSDTNSAGGTETLLFTAVGAGKTNLTLLYVNSPSDGSPSVSTNSFSVTVEVK